MLTYRLVGCPFCGWRHWFIVDTETNPGHECDQDVPLGMVVEEFTRGQGQGQQDPPQWPKVRTAA